MINLRLESEKSKTATTLLINFLLAAEYADAVL
jgi:hypothetical protein